MKNNKKKKKEEEKGDEKVRCESIEKGGGCAIIVQH